MNDTTLTPAEKIIDKYTGKAYDAIKDLAEALQVPAEYVYTILVKQQLVYSLTYSIAIVAAIALGVLFSKYGINGIGKAKDDEAGGWVAMTIVGTLSLVISTIVFFALIGDIVTGFVNPEYGAIKEILNTVK